MLRYLVLAAQIIIAVTFWLANYLYPDPFLHSLFYTFLALTIIYLVFKIVLQNLMVRQVKDEKMRYSLRRAVSIIYILTFIIVLILIWVENPQSILLSYGLIGAGLAIALQDVFRNMAGGVLILGTGLYKIGDRIEISSKVGDVIDIGIMYTTIMELREWVDADQATGRLSTVPNGAVIGSVVNNYSRDYNFIWDEMELPVTYDSDWRAASALGLKVLNEEMGSVIADAERELSEVMGKYYLEKRSLAPAVYMTLTDNWIDLHLRYPVSVRDRRTASNRISIRLMEEIERIPEITIASNTQTITITKVPEVRSAEEKGVEGR